MPDNQQDDFKVTDRRLFNPDGTPREQSAEEAQPQPQLATATAPEPVIDDATAEIPDDANELSEFMAVLMEIATPAFIHLGLAEHPATGRPEINLPAAQQAIDMLRVLSEKTAGNLSREEEDFFEGLLADLRMRFVSLRK